MMKPPEEGRIWEWRAFGRVSENLSSKIQSYPIRFGIDRIPGEDIYLISPLSDQNVKLRRYESGCVLKFKLLFETDTGPFELYNESAEFAYRFPVSVDRLKEASQLLGATLSPDAIRIPGLLDEAQFVAALAQASPTIADTRVTKIRSQYQFEKGWLELADVEFTSRSTQSLSVQSADLEVVKVVVKSLEISELEPMNYIEACRRWG